MKKTITITMEGANFTTFVPVDKQQLRLVTLSPSQVMTVTDPLGEGKVIAYLADMDPVDLHRNPLPQSMGEAAMRIAEAFNDVELAGYQLEFGDDPVVMVWQDAPPYDGVSVVVDETGPDGDWIAHAPGK